MAFSSIFAEKLAEKPGKKPINLMFSIGLKNAAFKHVSGLQYELNTPKDGVASIIAFSDRPTRVAFSIKPSRFFQLTHIGSSAYANNPPNISLVFDKNQIPDAVFQVKSYRITKKAVTYSLWLVGSRKPPNHYQGKMVIFVDGCSDTVVSHFQSSSSGTTTSTFAEQNGKVVFG